MQTLKTVFNTVDLSSRAKRRKVARLVAGFLERIRIAEEAYMTRIPDNLQGSDAYDDADSSIGLLDEAIDLVSSVYE